MSSAVFCDEALTNSNPVRKSRRTPVAAAIVELAPPAMPLTVAEEWANAHRPAWILDVLSERHGWVYEAEGEVVGWVSLTATKIDGLYRSPLTPATASDQSSFVSARRSWASRIHGGHAGGEL